MSEIYSGRPITDLQFFTRPKPGVPVKIIVLDQVADVPEPDYCTHGKATCLECEQWVWLGSESYKLVNSHQAYAVCLRCANTNHLIEPGTHVGKVKDHKRADGPHD